ncbi:serine/threonine protein kinase [Myxococcota bacterium]|nr:serine/threonine protein kinase [Myxococcota bacterium]
MRHCPGCQATIDTEPPPVVCPACGQDAPARGFPEDPLLGTTVDGRYRLEGRLGAGGMGVVYRARTRDGQLRAVKVLHGWLSQSEDMVRRFRREARAAARLHGPHAVRIEASGELPGGALFIAMELVEGESVSQRLRRAGWFEARDGLELLAQAATGLAEAHEAGLVHRDLKPDNLLLEPVEGSPGFRVRILDFGIVKHLDASLGTVGQTATGRVFGTPEFMSPEQARGAVDLDHRSDIFSLGVCAYLWWTGQLPFSGPNAQAIMIARLTEDALPMSEVRAGRRFPEALDALVARMLARDPAERWPSMEAVARAAREALAHLQTPAADVPQTRPVTPVAPPRRRSTPGRGVSGPNSTARRTLRVGLVVAAFLLAMWGVAWMLRPA